MYRSHWRSAWTFSQVTTWTIFGCGRSLASFSIVRNENKAFSPTSPIWVRWWVDSSSTFARTIYDRTCKHGLTGRFCRCFRPSKEDFKFQKTYRNCDKNHTNAIYFFYSIWLGRNIIYTIFFVSLSPLSCAPPLYSNRVLISTLLKNPGYHLSRYSDMNWQTSNAPFGCHFCGHFNIIGSCVLWDDTTDKANHFVFKYLSSKPYIYVFSAWPSQPMVLHNVNLFDFCHMMPNRTCPLQKCVYSRIIFNVYRIFHFNRIVLNACNNVLSLVSRNFIAICIGFNVCKDVPLFISTKLS